MSIAVIDELLARLRSAGKVRLEGDGEEDPAPNLTPLGQIRQSAKTIGHYARMIEDLSAEERKLTDDEIGTIAEFVAEIDEATDGLRSAADALDSGALEEAKRRRVSRTKRRMAKKKRRY